MAPRFGFGEALRLLRAQQNQDLEVQVLLEMDRSDQGEPQAANRQEGAEQSGEQALP